MNEFNGRGTKILFDVILPATMAIGTGIIAYLLTGGEEEFPVEETDKGEDHLNSTLDQENGHSTNLSTENTPNENDPFILLEEEIIQKMETLNQQIPDWAVELRQKLDLIQTDLQEMKEKILSSSTPPSKDSLTPDLLPQQPGSDDPTKQSTPPSLASSAPPPPLPTLSDYQRILHNAIYRFAYHLPDEIDCNVYELLDHSDFLQKEQSNPDPSTLVLSKGYLDGIDLLLLFIKNVMKFPTIPRYRRISINNTNFKTILQPLTGYHGILTSIGFQQKGIYYEFDWLLSATDGKSSSSLTSHPSQNGKESNTNGNSMEIPSIEFAVLLLPQMIDLLTALKVGKLKMLTTLQEQRGIKVALLPKKDDEEITKKTEDEPVVLSPAASSIALPLLDTPLSTSSVLSKAGGTPINKIGFLSNGSPLISTTTAFQREEILKKISKTGDFRPINHSQPVHPSSTLSLTPTLEEL